MPQVKRRFQMKSLSSLRTTAYALAAAVLAAWAIPANAATVPVTFDPNGFLYSYWINGTGGGSAANTPFAWNANVGETYTLRTKANTLTVGTFSVDAGGN